MPNKPDIRDSLPPRLIRNVTQSFENILGASEGVTAIAASHLLDYGRGYVL